MKMSDHTATVSPGAMPRPARAVAAVITTCALTLGITMLIWMKLRVVTTIPRTAYAEPEKAAEGKRTQAPTQGLRRESATPKP